MSEFNEVTRMWVEQMVGCDCDNGWRPDGPKVWQVDAPTAYSKCDRCVLVEVGGIRVRARLEAFEAFDTAPDQLHLPELHLPAVEVTDDKS